MKTLHQQICDAAQHFADLCEDTSHATVSVAYKNAIIEWQRLDVPKVPPRPAVTLEVEAKEKTHG